MRRLTVLLLTLGLATATLMACGSETSSLDPIEATVGRASVDPSAPSNEWVAGVNQAGWDFHRTIEGNAVSSPLSIGAAFSLLRAGATDPTATTLDNIFGFPVDAGTHTAANTILSQLAEPNNSTIVEIGNQLFTRIDPFQPFVDTAAAHYGAAMVPLSADNDKAVEEVNRWTNDQTHGLVPKIVDASNVTDQTQLIIVNTVYLDADWRYPFDASFTHSGDFRTDQATRVDADLMRTDGPLTLRYLRTPTYTVVELPYKDGGLAMWLIVPAVLDGLEAVEAELDAATIAAFESKAATGEVLLRMPKWGFALPPTDLLAGWLCPAGLCSGAPLTNIAPDLKLQFAVHGAKIIVDEEGTEAGAATAIGSDDSAPEIDLDLNIDHPFTYVIAHEPTGSIVFVGRVTDPTKS